MEDQPAAAAWPLPSCERCAAPNATASLTFSYRGEAYITRYYCLLCCDVAWVEAKAAVDAKAAALKERGL